MTRALLLVLACAACQRKSFEGERFYCDSSFPCATGFTCIDETCVAESEIECRAPDGGRGNCANEAFCSTQLTCESGCSAALFNDFSAGPKDLYLLKQPTDPDWAGRAEDGGERWIIAATVTDAGDAFQPSTGVQDPQPLASCGFSFDVAEVLPAHSDDGWQLMLRYDDGAAPARDSVGFNLSNDRVYWFLEVNGGIPYESSRDLVTYHRFSVLPRHGQLVYYAGRRGGAWEELGRTPVPDGGLPPLRLVMWVGCFGSPCVEGEQRRAAIDSYNVDFPPGR